MITFRLAIQTISASALFGMWQNSLLAGLFLFSLLGTIMPVIDYLKEGE